MRTPKTVEDLAEWEWVRELETSGAVTDQMNAALLEMQRAEQATNLARVHRDHAAVILRKVQRASRELWTPSQVAAAKAVVDAKRLERERANWSPEQRNAAKHREAAFDAMLKNFDPLTDKIPARTMVTLPANYRTTAHLDDNDDPIAGE